MSTTNDIENQNKNAEAEPRPATANLQKDKKGVTFGKYKLALQEPEIC